MVCNDLVMPVLLRGAGRHARRRRSEPACCCGIRRGAIVVVLLLGYLYFHLAGEAYALVSIGLISFAAVAQFAPAHARRHVLARRHPARRAGRAAGRLRGLDLHADAAVVRQVGLAGRPASCSTGPFGHRSCCKPAGSCSAWPGWTSSPTALFWSLLGQRRRLCRLCRCGARRPRSEASQAPLFVDVFKHAAGTDRAGLLARHAREVRTCSSLADALPGPGARPAGLFARLCAPHRRGPRDRATCRPMRRLVHFVETLLAGAIGSASARVMVASVAQEEPLGLDEVMQHPRRGLPAARLQPRAGAEIRVAGARPPRELRAANEQLKEPGPAEGRLHVLGHARTAHAADLDPRLLRDAGRRPDMVELAERQQFPRHHRQPRPSA